jgi:hypothetical protein
MIWARTELQEEISLKSAFASSNHQPKKVPGLKELKLKQKYQISIMESTFASTQLQMTVKLRLGFSFKMTRATWFH